MLSTPAFNALLKILEEPPEHLMFILATTELHKVPATIKSRCQQFAFKRLRPDQIAGRLNYVAGQEGIDLSEGGAELLSRLADGGMRDALSLLDQCRGAANVVNEDTILQSLGMAGNLETAQLLTELAKGQSADAMAHFARLYSAGKDVRTLLNELSTLTRDLLLRKTAPRGGNALLVGGYDDATMRSLSELLTAPRLIQMLTLLQGTVADLQKSGNPRTDCELCLIRLSDETLDGSAVGLSARVARLETMLSYPAAPVTQPVPAAQPTAVPAAKPTPTVQPSVAPTPAAALQKASPAPAGNKNAFYEDVKPFKKLPEDPWAVPVPTAPPAPAQEPAAPPPWDDDAPPPWETEPPAPTPQEMPSFAAKMEPSRPSQPVYQPPQTVAPQDFAPSGGDDTLFWNALLPGLKPLLSPAVWPFVSNAAMTVGRLRENSLELEAKVSVTKAMIDKPEVLSVIAQAAQARLGRPVEVRVSAPAPAVGRMDDLLEFGRNFNQDK